MLINPYALAAAAGNDPFFANVSLLLHMDATSGGTLVDSSSNAFVPSHNTAIILDTTHQLAGAACMEFASVLDGSFAGNDISLAIATSGPLDLSTGDYTVEWYMYFNTMFPGGGIQDVFFLLSGLTAALITSTTSGQLQGTVDGSSITGPSGGGGLITAATWCHVALTMASNVATLSCNGIAGTPVSVSRQSWAGGQTFWIGGSQFGPSYAGKGQEFRVTKGVARYTSFPFTPPSAPFPNS